MVEWVTGESVFEGFPLVLRIPLEVDWKTLELTCTELLTVTHTFANHQPNGQPVEEQDDGPAKLDLALQNAFLGIPNAEIVLVETYGGKRNSYFYISREVSVSDQIGPIQKEFSEYAIDHVQQPDPGWLFIEQYTAEFFPEHIFPRRTQL